MKSKSAEKVKLKSFDDLFGIDTAAGVGENVVCVPLSLLHTFKDHPFRVLDDEKMQETVDSIKRHGVLMPGIVRPHGECGYEVIAGHRRWRACVLAGMKEMPVIIRELDDDEATIIMADSNIQREDILPSEKAKAYAMKYEAMRHQGKRGSGNSLDAVGEAAGESGKTVQRFIWLARLSDKLLDLVDKKKIGFVQGVEISFLTEQAQGWIEKIVEETGISISKAQAKKLKECGKGDELTQAMVREILLGENLQGEKRITRKVILSSERIREYFAEEYSSEEIEKVIYQLLEEWKSRQ